MIHPLLFELCWIACVAMQPTQTLQYSVWHGEHQVGNMQVAQFDRGDQTAIQVRMEAEVSLFFKLTIISTYETTFQDGEMTTAKVRTYRNGDLQSYTDCWREADELHIDRDGERSTVPEAIEYTIANLYFQRPENQRAVFSERFGSFQLFEKLSETCYRLDLSDGSRSTYTYQDGLCKRVEIETWLVDLRMELVDVK